MLVHAADYLREHGHLATHARYFTQEMNRGNAAIGKTNSVLHGLEADIRADNSTITDPQFLGGGEVRKFSLVLANFPFSDDDWWLKSEQQTDDKTRKARLEKEIFGKLYRRVCLGEPFEPWVRETLEAMLAGEHDEALVYRKRLRQSVEEYTRNVPLHVQAARKLGRRVRYVITPTGPEPVEDGRAPPRPDYDHYRERQLAPAADGLLRFLDTSFEAITDRQMGMF